MNNSSNKLDDKPPSKLLDKNKQNGSLTVYVYNIVEDELSFLNSYSDSIRTVEDIERDESTADCFYLGMVADNKDLIYVSPKSISADFQTYARELFHSKNDLVINPNLKSHQLCLDLLNDQENYSKLLKICKNYSRVTLLSYAATPQFYKLKEGLLKDGVQVSTPEAPEQECSWTVNFFGSKSGIRQLAQKSVAAEPDFIMPDGIICVGKLDAAKIAANKFIKNHGVVIKTNKGCGGSGVLIFREGDLPSEYLSCQKKIEEILSQENYWEKFPIVVEDLVNVNNSIAGGFPNVEFKIKKNGVIEMLFHGITLVTPKGEYYGMEVNEDILPDRLTTRMIDTGYYIAEQYSAAGYRGHFDIDMMIGKNNQLYVCESNTRNTGWTDVYRVVKKLIGANFLDDAYSLSESRFKLSKTKYTQFEALMSRLNPVLYFKKTKTGVIINSENLLKNKELLYTIVAKNKKQAYKIQEEMRDLLS